ncbi:MAG: hypothetical protein WCJ41_20920 [Aestuariivirga sp.]|uniref:bestrophin-like domain n=1 Tax=Aestuariivirga sp. TaxID=2650926 RepID=UPI003015EADB
MISFIQTLPVFLGLPLVIGSGILLTLLGTLVAGTLFTPAELIENNAVGGFKFAFLAQIVAALLAFSLVDSATRFVSFQFRCDRELAAISLMQKVENFLPVEASRLRLAESEYLKSVINDEWSKMREGKQSEGTTKALEDWYAKAMATTPRNDQERLALSQYMRLFAEVVINRTGRISDSTSPFENLIWLSVGIAVIITIAFNWFFGSYNLLTQLAMGALLTTGVMTLVYLSVVLASPINSPIGILPTSYITLLQ